MGIGNLDLLLYPNSQILILNYFFLAAAFFLAAGLTAGRLLPNDPLKRFPLAVFLSPLPMIVFLIMNE